MKIYLAGSFKNIFNCRGVGELLRAHFSSVYVFCDAEEDAYRESMAVREGGREKTMTMIDAVHDATVNNIYQANRLALDWCDAVIVLLPCGKSAHLEAGYVIGKGKPAFVIGEPILGEWDAMYCMLNGVFPMTNEGFVGLVNALRECERQRN